VLSVGFTKALMPRSPCTTASPWSPRRRQSRSSPLLSALHFHKLGLERPWQAWIALPRGSWAPRLTSQTLRISWLDEAELAQDVEHHSIDGVPVQVFSPARAVVETFHFFRQVGLEPALDALKDYLSRGPNGVQPLMAIARRRRAYNKMRPYVEALL
jgi:hypothetical protein